MKSWEIVLVVGVVAIVGVMVLMKSSRPKATPVNSSFSAPNGALNGLAASAIGGLVSAITKPSGAPYYPNQGTYQTGIVPIQSGNTLTDPNTGSTLVYGTD